MEDFFTGVESFWLPYLISQLVSIILLIVAWRNTRIARSLFSILFLWASMTNLYTAMTSPQVYLEYADMAIPLYRDFINGWFGDNYETIIPIIAIGQLLIAVGMILKNLWVTLACIGSIIFLLSIAPLLVGSAFPFSITVSIAAWLILKKDPRNYLWESLKSS